MRKSVTITKSGVYVVDEVGAFTERLRAGDVVAVPEVVAETLVGRGVAELVIELDEAPAPGRRKRAPAAPVEETGDVELGGEV